MNYQPVFSLKTDWIVGVIDNHTAKPLTEYEVTMACEQLNKIPALVAEVERLQDGERWIASKLAEITAVAISGLADAAVVGTGPFNADDTLAAVKAMQKRVEELEEDGKRLDWLEHECFDLRCEDIPTGAGDADVEWIIISHHMSKPHEREEGIGGDSVRSAIDAARAQKGEQ